MHKLYLKKGRSGPVRAGHPWIFSGAIANLPEGLKTGEVVNVYDDEKSFLATGYFNSYSQISVRLWGYDENELVDQEFFARRIGRALELRQNLIDGKSTNAYRLIHGENDWLPGLIVDRYGDYLSVQFHNRAVESWREMIVAALVAVIKPLGIYERSESASRRFEGAIDSRGLLYGEMPDSVIIKENGLRFSVDIKEGQKTGFFLDQRDKRLALQKYATGRRVLNAFAYTGGFSVYALAAGAAEVISLDISAPAITKTNENIQLNNLDKDQHQSIVDDAKDYLAGLEKNNFDLIILDPPAFIKDRRKVSEGLRGYRRINEDAMRALPAGGILVTCSCSAHLSLPDFRHMLSEAAIRAGRRLRILETHTHGLDHPQLSAYIEGDYLKTLFCQVF